MSVRKSDKKFQFELKNSFNKKKIKRIRFKLENKIIKNLIE